MELTTLRYFTAVAKELHFRKAAALLHITQAPLSIAIRKLEDELGVMLFERTNRAVRLTPEGAFFLPEAEAVLNRAATAKARLQEMARKQARLVIGYNEPALNSFLPNALALTREKNPNLNLELRELETSEQLRMLRNGKLNIGLMRPIETELAGLSHKLILREEYRIVMPHTHPLAKKKAITGEDLKGQEIILFAREVNAPVYDRLTMALTIDSAHPPIFRQDARNKNSMFIMTEAGFGVALIPDSCCRRLQPGLVAKPILMELPSVDVMAVWDPVNETPELKNFLSLLPDSIIPNK